MKADITALVALLLSLAGAVASEWPEPHACTTDAECGCAEDCHEPLAFPFLV